MRTTFAQPSISAAESECKETSYIDGLALLGTVFLRTRFGEQHLSPASLVKGSALVAIALFFLRYEAGLKSACTMDPSRWSGAYLLLLGAIALACFEARVVVIATWLAAYYGVYYVAKNLWPSFALPARSDFATIAWSFFAFGLIYMVVAACQMVRSTSFTAPPGRSCGTSLKIWMRVPSALRPWRNDWDIQRYVEPAVIAAVGFLLIGVFSNWLGGFLLLVAIAVSASAATRFRDARLIVVSMASGARMADTVSANVDAAVETKPAPMKPPPMKDAEPFVARPVRRN